MSLRASLRLRSRSHALTRRSRWVLDSWAINAYRFAGRLTGAGLRCSCRSCHPRVSLATFTPNCLQASRVTCSYALKASSVANSTTMCRFVALPRYQHVALVLSRAAKRPGSASAWRSHTISDLRSSWSSRLLRLSTRRHPSPPGEASSNGAGGWCIPSQGGSGTEGDPWGSFTPAP